MSGSSMTEHSDAPGLNLLCFDGGGITGLSSLLLVREAMSQLQAKTRSLKRPDPWEHFDLIAGTGTGAICAVMLGRLRMSVDDAIIAYSQLSSRVYCDKKLMVHGGTGAFRATKLEEGLKEIVRKYAGDSEERMIEERPNESGCKVVVYAMSAHNLNAGLPCAFRSYPANANAMPDCPIWKALRASTAHPDLFKSIEIQELGIGQHYVGGGLGCSNPTAQLLKEAAALYPDRSVASIVSIGAGHAKTLSVPQPSRIERLLPAGMVAASQALRTAHQLATDNERVAEEMTGRFSGIQKLYYRLNVDQGMQGVKPSEWEKQSEIASHTRLYMEKEETKAIMSGLVNAVCYRLAVVPATHIDGRVASAPRPLSMAASYCPPPTSLFTGRETEVAMICRYFGTNGMAQKVFVLSGLGGAGKTQTALKAAEMMASRRINGSSCVNIKTALSRFATSMGIGSAYMDTLKWLGSCHARWLLLFDNVDDPSIRVHEYFPHSGKYSILVTTRHQDVARLARGKGSHCNLSELQPNDARQLLLEVAGLKENGLDDQDAVAVTQLIEDFGYLALAIVQCGAYIWRTKCSVSRYQRMYLTEGREMLDEEVHHSLELFGYKLSVYTTWALSYIQVGILSRQLLGLSAFLQSDTISEEIFRRAGNNIQKYSPEVPPSQTEIDVRSEVESILSSFTDGRGVWSSRIFLSAMGELVCLSLVTLNPSKNLYRIHPLVQQWARAISPDPKHAAEQTAFLLALSIDRQNGAEDRAFRHSILPHVNEIMEICRTTNSNYAWRFIAVYDEVWNLDKLEGLEFQVLKERTSALGPEHPETLEAERYVAGTHLVRGRLSEAASLCTHVLEARKRVLGADHHVTLETALQLATTYDAQHRSADAETLRLETLAALQQAAGRDHNITLDCMLILARRYRIQGQWKKWEDFTLQVLAARKRTLGADHRDSLDCMSSLAMGYHEQGRLTEAGAIHLELIAIQKRTLGDDNRLTLTSTANLAATYHAQGRLAEAEKLYWTITPMQKRVLGNDHKDTVQVMHNLAQLYKSQSRRADYSSLMSELQATKPKARE